MDIAVHLIDWEWTSAFLADWLFRQWTLTLTSDLSVSGHWPLRLTDWAVDFDLYIWLDVDNWSFQLKVELHNFLKLVDLFDWVKGVWNCQVFNLVMGLWSDRSVIEMYLWLLPTSGMLTLMFLMINWIHLFVNIIFFNEKLETTWTTSWWTIRLYDWLIGLSPFIKINGLPDRGKIYRPTHQWCMY